MKRNVLNLSFDFVFTLGVIMSLLLPYIAMAKTPQYIKVTIVNNDTTINGENIKNLSATERKEALREINNAGKQNIRPQKKAHR